MRGCQVQRRIFCLVRCIDVRSGVNVRVERDICLPDHLECHCPRVPKKIVQIASHASSFPRQQEPRGAIRAQMGRQAPGSRTAPDGGGEEEG